MKKLLSVAVAAAAGSLAADISDLTAEYRSGQVFIQWKESGLSPEARLTVWSSAEPITEQNVQSARKLAGLLNPGSARDWWRDVASFRIQKVQTLKDEEIFAGQRAGLKTGRLKDRGFILTDFGKPISPDGGLHVHTPMTEEETGKRYYAVSCMDQGKPAGFAALEKPVSVRLGKPQVIQISGRKMPRGCGKGRPLFISLHGRGGGVGVDAKGRALGTHLFFADRTLGWREGLPFKFTVSVTSKPDRVAVSFYDRFWIGRNLSKAEYSDGRDQVKAISSFWMGYNPRIGESLLGPDFVCDNYTERLLLKLIDWIQDHFQTDPAAVYISGGSMGGTGAIQLATHFPNRFAAVSAIVPIYSYTWKPSQVGGLTSAWRMQCSVGKFTRENPPKMPDGKDLLEYLDGEKNIARPGTDIPPIFACNGRSDQSMPWANNPPFYAAADQAKQFLAVYWNDGTHSMAGKMPDDIKKAMALKSLLRFRLDAGYPVFSRCSDNKDPGNGDIKSGDITGWMNRGIDWKTLADEPGKYAIRLNISHPEIHYPVTADVTIRRRQKFLPAPDQELQVRINGKTAAKTIRLDRSGLLTIPAVTITDRNGVDIEVVKP